MLRKVQPDLWISPRFVILKIFILTVNLLGLLSIFTVINSQTSDNSDEYVQIENKQDQFDWKLTKVSWLN